MARETTPATGGRKLDYFDDGDVSTNMTGNIVRGSAFLAGASVGSFAINVVSTMILGRLLDPEAYGLLAMVFVVTSFLTQFRDLNLSLATVQKQRITHSQISTIYWINVAISCAIALIVLALAPGISWFYDEPRLTAIAACLALTIVIRGFASQHKALLRRKMRFGAMVGIDLASMLAGYSVAVGIAWHGFGYWALVWLHLTTAIADLVLCWVVTGWRPSLAVRGSGVRAMVAFGTNLTAYAIVRYVSRSLDNAIIGWSSGASGLGVYSRSRDLVGQVTGYAQSPFSAVGVPSLSRQQNEPANYRRTFRRLAEKIALLALPATVMIFCTASDIVEVLLGPKWAASAPILKILAVLISTESIFGAINWLFISQGRGAQLLRYGVFDSGSRAVAIFIGMQWGTIGIAVALALTAVCLHLPAQIWYACRQGPVRQADVYRMLAPLVLGSLVGLVAVQLAQRAFPSGNPLITIAVSGATLAAVELLVLLVTPSGRQIMRDLRRGLDILWRWRENRG
jgi:O-antigen/teichoic acid export membrane protein